MIILIHHSDWDVIVCWVHNFYTKTWLPFQGLVAQNDAGWFRSIAHIGDHISLNKKLVEKFGIGHQIFFNALLALIEFFLIVSGRVVG